MATATTEVTTAPTDVPSAPTEVPSASTEDVERERSATPTNERVVDLSSVFRDEKQEKEFRNEFARGRIPPFEMQWEWIKPFYFDPDGKVHTQESFLKEDPSRVPADFIGEEKKMLGGAAAKEYENKKFREYHGLSEKGFKLLCECNQHFDKGCLNAAWDEGNQMYKNHQESTRILIAEVALDPTLSEAERLKIITLVLTSKSEFYEYELEEHPYL